MLRMHKVKNKEKRGSKSWQLSFSPWGWLLTGSTITHPESDSVHVYIITENSTHL